jgi:ribosomal-protein-alanine N-acetyltransferase
MASDIHLEPARPRDVREIAAMSRELIEHGLLWRWRPEAVLRLVRDSDTAVIVSREGGARLLGFASMSFDWKRARSHLVLLAVRPCAQRRGMGRELVRWVELVARRGGITWIGLEVRASSTAAHRFYRSLGYHETGRIRGYYQGREDALTMASSLRTRSSERAND